MSAHQGHLPGRPARNGLPVPSRWYSYRGTGQDTRTNGMALDVIAADITAHEGTEYQGYDSSLSEVPGASGRKPGGRK